MTNNKILEKKICSLSTDVDQIVLFHESKLEIHFAKHNIAKHNIIGDKCKRDLALAERQPRY